MIVKQFFSIAAKGAPHCIALESRFVYVFVIDGEPCNVLSTSVLLYNCAPRKVLQLCTFDD